MCINISLNLVVFMKVDLPNHVELKIYGIMFAPTIYGINYRLPGVTYINGSFDIYSIVKTGGATMILPKMLSK